jgi:NAD(P)H dehydrogenase (quinone)
MRHSFARRCFVAVLVLAASATCAPLGSAFAADKGKKDEPADSIVISGASGGLAGEAIEALITRGVPIEKLILVTRTPDKLSWLAERGATVREGDFDKPDALPAAFAGGKQLLLISTSGGGDRVAQHTAAINAARRAGIKHIVYTSWVNPVEGNPAAVSRDHQMTEDVLLKSGIAYTILRNQLYADGLIAQGARAIATGQIVSNSGRGKWAPVARRDCAAAAAAVLATPGHERQTYYITGPDLISEADFAKLLTQVTGKSVRVIDVDDATYVGTLENAGVPEEAAKRAASFGAATRASYLNIKSDTLQILLGHAPQSVRELLTANKAQLLAPAASAAR